MLRRPLVGVTAAMAMALAPTVAYAAPTPAKANTPSPSPGSTAAPTSAQPRADQTTGITHDQNDRVPEGASWTEQYFGSTDGVELHADVLRPANLGPNDKSPVILSVGPYFGHIGSTDDEGFTHTGPSARFNDLITGAKLMQNGYTVVLVDLRGFGASTGCLDWSGPGEQADIDAAIRWSAKQTWSTGKVGMYGKSYDAGTGLIGNNLGTPGLKAVVAQEPVWDGYNYLYSNGVPRPNVTGTPAAYNGIAGLPGMSDDTDHYKKNADYEKSHPECYANNLSNAKDSNHDSPYWKSRNIAAKAAGSSTPVFVTQGFIEPNTKPESMQEFLANHTGEERGWLGQWEHVRGNETNDDGVLKMGRKGWFDEVMRFYDKHLKGVQPSVQDPNFVVEDSLGRWRAQDTWPTRSAAIEVPLKSGSYLDASSQTPFAESRSAQANGDMEHGPAAPGLEERKQQSAATPRSGDYPLSFDTFSKPVTKDVRLTATPRVSLDIDVPDGVTSSQVMVRLWDISNETNADGTHPSTMLDENVAHLSGDGKVSFDLKSTDWVLRKGHTLGVGVGAVSTRGWSWVITPTKKPIRVVSGSLTVATQSTDGDKATQGDPSPYLAAYVKGYTGVQATPMDATFSLRDNELGAPQADRFCGLIRGGCYQHFGGASLYSSPATGQHLVRGAIRDRYAGLGWERSGLGYPTSEETCGLRDSGCVQRFEGGLMYWSPSTGANPVFGAIRDRYAAMGWENSALGYPTSGEKCGLTGGGCFQKFSGGSMYWSPASGAWPVWGAIYDHWAANGWEFGRYGYPTGPETCGAVPGAFECSQRFQNRTLVWNSVRGFSDR